MHDHAIARRHEVDDLAHRGGFLVTGDNKSPRMDLGRIAGLIEEGPDVAGLVLIVQVSRDIHQVHLNPPLARSASSVRGIGLNGTEGFQQFPELLVAGAAQPHGEMRTLPGGQQLKSAISQTANGEQVDSPERGEPAPEQTIQRLAQDGEN